MCVVKDLLNTKGIIIIFIFCLIAVPAAFAADSSNQTDLESADSTDILSADTPKYYFNASIESDDGNGSADNPYKYLTSARIKHGCDIYLADGEYDLDSSVEIYNVNMHGESSNGTVINFNGSVTIRTIFRASDITFNGMTFYNYNIFNATNANFINGHGVKDRYGSFYGGAIYSYYASNTQNTKVTLINCSFKDNTANYGGAVYIKSGYLTVENTTFLNNAATNFGGAIACENSLNVSISKSRFIKNNSTQGSGGALYIKKSNLLNIRGSVFTGSNARFGGAVAILNTTTSIGNCDFVGNSARYMGGAVFQIYSTFESENSTYKLNTALNGAGAYIDHTDLILIKNNSFENNTALNLGGAIYSILNNRTYAENNTLKNNDFYTQSELDLQIGSGNYTMYKFDDYDIGELPSSYSMLDYGLLTPVKDQMSSGNCWAFAMICVLESCLKKITYSDFDLSEENVKNLMSLYSDYGTTLDTNEGAYASTAISYLTSWLGPIYEIDDIYGDLTTLSTVFNSILHVQNVAFLKRESPTDNDEIKSAILKYGAVGASMYWKSTYLKNNLNYNSGKTEHTTNHAATIVGWDDNYSKDNFYGYPEGDGAWIVRSSWGDDWANGGYCYVSYYDVNFAKWGEIGKIYTIVLNDTVRFDKNYQYDIAGPTTYIGAKKPSIAYKNRFTSTNNEILSGVSTYFNKEYNWTMTVYVNDAVKSQKSGNSPAGYWTINLDEAIPLYTGDVFEVEFNLTCDTTAQIPISQAKSINTVTFRQGESFINLNGKRWQDLYNLSEAFPSQVACIKAFTVLKSPETTANLTVTYIGHNLINITANVVDEFANPARGNVTFNLDEGMKVMNLTNGTASFIYLLNKTVLDVSVSFNAQEYKPSSDWVSFEITPKEIELTLNITIKDLNNVHFEITSTEDVNETLTIAINGTEVNVEIINKTASYYIENMENGNYTANVYLNSTLAYTSNNITDSFTVAKYPVRLAENKDITIYYGAGKSYSVRVYGEDGKPLSKGTVKMTIGGKSRNVNINSNGYASLKITQKPGKYTIICEYKGVKVSNKITVKATLITKNIKVKKSKKIKFKAKLLNSKGKVLKNKKITFKIKSKKYKVRTNKKGIATLKLKNLKVGKHKITTVYKNLKNKNKITVKK